MSVVSDAYTELLFRPLFNLLVGITNVLPGHSVGWSIIIVTFLVRLLLLPSSVQQARHMHNNQQKMEIVKKEITRIKKEHKTDTAKQAEETMKLYKEVGINPAQGCLSLVIQIPILLALYRVFLVGFNPESFEYLYNFVRRPEVFHFMFFGIDLSTSSLLLGVLAGIGQFIQMRMINTGKKEAPSSVSDSDPAAMMAHMQKHMTYVFPVMTIFVALQLPAALALYWTTATVFGMAQQYMFKRFLNISPSVPIA